MFNKELATKLDAFVKEKFPMIYEFEFEGYVFLRGGTLRSIIMGIPVKDLDFVILSQGKCQIVDFIRKFKLKYHKNAGGSYKIIYNNFYIDICTVNDLMDTATYDIDFIFYDLETKHFLSFGGIKAIEDKTITEIKMYGIPLYSHLTRIKKLMNFVSYASGSKKIKVNEKKVFFYFRFYKKIIKERVNNIINGNFKKCFHFLADNNKLIKLIILFKFIIEFISVINPLLVGITIINILLKQYINTMLLIGVIIILKILAKCICLVVSRWDLKLYNDMKFNICSDMVKALFCYQNNSNIFMDKIKNDPEVISEMYINLRDKFIRIICFVLMLLFVVYMNYIIGILTIASVFLVYKYNRNKVRSMFYNKGLIDGFNCMSTFGDMFYSKKNQLTSISNKKDKKYKNYILIILLIVILSMLFLMLQNNNIELYSFIFIFIYILKIFIYMKEFKKIEFEYHGFNSSCFRMFNLLNGTCYMNEVFGKYYSSCDGQIEFDNVKFRYDYNSKYVFNNCSFKINSGDVVLLVGDKKSGKSTILNLMSRLYQVDDGSVKIDNVNINEYSEKYIRDNIVIISKNSYFFDISIKDNLRLVKKDVTDKEIEKVCKLVGLNSVINKLPYKYNTIIGKDGIKLTDIQIVKLSMARALLNNSKILLLDNIIDSEIIKILKKIKKNHTIVITSNKLLSDDVFSRVLSLDSRGIVEG